MRALDGCSSNSDLGVPQERGAKGEQSARRVLKLLNYISEHGQSMTAKIVAHELGVSLPTAYHVINSLIQEGYIERRSGSKGYRLGRMIPLLYQRSLGQGDLVSDVEPVLDHLAEQSGQRTYLAVYREGEVMVVHRKCAPGSPRLPEADDEGYRDAEHALALGKVLLADISDETMKAYKDNKALEAYTAKTITDPCRLESCLNQVRSEGFATDLEEFAEGFCCIAAPIRGGSGGVEASVGISIPSRRFRVEGKSFANLVIQAGHEASAMRGHKPRC